MKTHKTDRRSVRTRRLVTDAFVSLLRERRYDDITVQDLLDRADIGRSTFYAQYYDKDDVLASIMDHLVAALSDDAPEGKDSAANAFPIPVLRLLRHIQEQDRLYRALERGRGFAQTQQALHTALRDQALRWLRQHATASDDATLTLAAEAVAGAFLATLRWRLAADLPLSPEATADHFERLLAPGIRHILGLPDKAGG